MILSRWALAYGIALFALGLGRTALESRMAVDGPDREVTMVRDYTSALSAEILGLSLQATTNWPDWHYHATRAQAVDADAKPLPMNFQAVETGSRVMLTVEPKGQAWKRFVATLSIREFTPRKTLHVEWVHDSKGKIAALVDSLEWRIDLEPTEGGSHVRHQVWARTRGPRARWFARFFPNIFLHQLGMADLGKLIELRRPSPVIPIPQVQR